MTVDPQQFGKMQAEVEGLRRDISHLTSSISSMSTDMRALREQIDQAKGGWKMLLGISGAAATAGALVSTWMAKWFHVAPPGP